MRAFQIEAPGVVKEISVPVPEIAEDEVLFRIAYAGICATDYEILGGEMNLVKEGKIRYPVRFGHEYSGVVEKVGSKVTKYKPGDRVIGDALVTCGKCPACLEGRYGDCTQFRAVGTMYCWDGCFAEYMHMPERHLFHLPEGVSMKECALIEPSCVAYAGLKRGGDLKDKTIVIVGTGAIGMTAVALAKCFQPKKILLAGRTDSKLEIGRRLGATRLVNIRREELIEAVMQETDGKGADFIMETSGNLDMVNRSVRCAKYGGVVSYIGFYDRPAVDFPIDVVVSNKVTIAGIMSDSGAPEEVIALFAKYKMDMTPIISHIIGMDQLEEALIHPEKLPQPRIKVLVEIGGEM